MKSRYLQRYMCLWLGLVFLVGFLQLDEKFIKQWSIFTRDIKPCLPTKNIMFLKTHKTASSTVLNILFRFSEKHSLTVALASGSNIHLGYPSLFKATFVEEFKTIGQNFNIMCNHLRFNLPEVRKVMPKDTFYFSILRDPILSLESSYVYYKNYSPAFRNSSNVNEFLSSPWSYYNLSVKKYNVHTRNNMWFDFGYDNNAVYDDRYIQSTIKNIEQNFHLILIADYFDESMILLKNTLHWDLDDVVYFKLNTRSLDSVQTLTPESKEKVKEWCALDWELYKHFNNTFWIKIQKMMSLASLYQEVKLLQKRQKKLMEKCLLEEMAIDESKIKDKKMKPYQSGVANILGYNLKQDLGNATLKICQRMIMPEVQYVSYLYSHQFPNKTVAMGSRHFPARTVLFERETSGVTYRVPALLYIPCVAKLLAFAEERLSVDDAHANLLVLRRGTFYKNYVEWEDMRALETATLAHHRSMNPCPIYDELTGMVFLFFIAVLGRTPEAFQIITGQNAARLCYVSSSDQGISWSHVTDLTQQVIGRTIEDWATFALGPGHGIQLKSGRLLLPAYAYHIDCKECFGKLCKTTPHAFTFYSDDHGQSWDFGEFIPNLQTVECQMVSVDEEDGSNMLYCNARSPLGFRVQALSTDDGAVFQSGQLVQRLVEPPHGCHGSIVGFQAPLYYLQHNIHTVRRQTQSVQSSGLLLQPSTEKGNHTPLPPPPPVPSASLCSQSLYHQQESFGLSRPCSSHHSNFLSLVSLGKEYTGQEKDNIGTISKSDYNFQIPTWVLYSHPTSSRSRVNLGIYLSTFPRDADNWTEPWVIYEGPSAYSDLAYIELPYSEFSITGIPAIAFACLYENGVRSPYEQISFSMFTLHEVLQNIPLTTSSSGQKQPSGDKKRWWRTCVVS